MKAEYISHMGSDLTVTNAARVSFNKESKWENETWGHKDFEEPNYLSEKDVKLIKYLASHGHFTPFTHPQITMREKVPIFVARQRFKHVVGFSYNEVSRRYVDDEPEFYYPSEWRTKPEGSIKQGSGTGKLPEPDFKYGFCKNCGIEIEPITRHQGGGQTKIYCCDTCKYHYNNMNRNPYKAIWSNAQARAKREGKEWSIDFDTFVFPSHCSILKIELDYSLGKGRIKDNSPSFDRIDPNKDYVKENVRIISNKANTMKSNANVDELVTFAKSVLLQHKGVIVKEDFSYDGVIKKAMSVYNLMIKEGYSAEQARMILPQSTYTEYWVTGSLAAWARAYKQRIDPHAQKEIQDLAKQWGEIIEPLFPVSWQALLTHE